MKKIKDTKLGKILKNRIPHIFDLVSDLIPDRGVLGVVKNIISGDAGLSAEEKKELQEEINRQEEIFAKDRADARANETARDVSENAGWLSKNIHELMAIIMSVIYLAVICISLYLFVNEFITIEQLGVILAVTGLKEIVIMIFSYLYGRSKPQK